MEQDLDELAGEPSASATSTSSWPSAPRRTSTTTASGSPRRRARRPRAARPSLPASWSPCSTTSSGPRGRRGRLEAADRGEGEAERGGLGPGRAGARRGPGPARAAADAERAGVEAYDPAGEPFDPAWHEAISTRAAAEGTEPGTVLETLERGYRLGRPGAAARPRGRERVGGAMATPRDFYEVLGVDRKASGGRDQEGLPRAGPQVASRPQPRRPRGRGAVQGGPAGLRHALGPREAQAVRRRRDVRRRRRRRSAPARGGFPGGGFASDLGDIFSSFFGRGGGARPGRGRSPGATSRPRSSSASTRRCAGPRSRSRCRRPGACPTCGGSGAKPGTSPEGLPALRGARRGHREPGLLLDPAAVPRVRRPGQRHRGALRDLLGQRHHPGDASATGSTSPRASTTGAASGWPARARPATAAARGATST